MPKEMNNSLDSLLEKNSKRCADGSREISIEVFLEATKYEEKGFYWKSNVDFNGKGWMQEIIYKEKIYLAWSETSVPVSKFLKPSNQQPTKSLIR